MIYTPAGRRESIISRNGNRVSATPWGITLRERGPPTTVPTKQPNKPQHRGFAVAGKKKKKERQTGNVGFEPRFVRNSGQNEASSFSSSKEPNGWPAKRGEQENQLMGFFKLRPRVERPRPLRGRPFGAVRGRPACCSYRNGTGPVACRSRCLLCGFR